jgi:hypothetical protein
MTRVNNRTIIITSFRAFEDEVYKQASRAYDEASIVEMLANTQLYNISRNVVETTEDIQIKVTLILKDCEFYKRIQRVLMGQVIMPTNRADWFLWEAEKEHTFTLSRQILLQDFKADFRWERSSKSLKVVYNPKKPLGLFTQGPDEEFNLYKPPFWKKEVQQSTGIYPRSELPEIYKRFLTHLTGGDEESINYILDWAAYSINEGPKNKTYLTAIGAQGVGKGVLSKILMALHGDSNSLDTTFSAIADRFNGSFADKVFIFLDEVIHATDEQMNFLKRQENDKHQVERKGKEKEDTENFNNIYIASNHLDSLRLEPGDRRFGIINIGTTRLEAAFTQAEIRSMYLDNDLVRSLGNYLMHRETNPKYYSDGYKSANAVNVLNASTKDWEQCIKDDLCTEAAGKTITCAAAIAYVRFKGSKAVPTINTLKFLAQRFSGIFEVKRTSEYYEFGNDFTRSALVKAPEGNNKRVWCIEILPKDKQKQYETIEKED